jgi:isochorismate pyruvate lyase
MKPPADCTSLSDVRLEIDRIDEQIIGLLGQRAGYVKAAAQFKINEAAVTAPERQAAMMKVRRQWATREGLDADFIEDMYRRLVAYFVSRQLQHWKGAEPQA